MALFISCHLVNQVNLRRDVVQINFSSSYVARCSPHRPAPSLFPSYILPSTFVSVSYSFTAALHVILRLIHITLLMQCFDPELAARALRRGHQSSNPVVSSLAISSSSTARQYFPCMHQEFRAEAYVSSAASRGWFR